ncbi:MAG TPA: hypothetical protein VHQ66_10285, partial [Myxococcota bacterium]|nr:hypothetical protein [Myxococcota bacterium]
RGVVAALVVTLALAAPRVAHACYVCMSGREDDSGRAFLLGSVLLSVLPFALFGGIALWIWRRVRAAERERAASEPPRGAARVPAPDGEEIGARPV